jgi:hypothetical protein
MNATARGLGLAVMVVGALTSAAARAADAQPSAACDRACLQSVADKYLRALVAHDPYSAPIASNVRITENGQRIGYSAGLWKTASADSAYRLYFADPATGQIGFIGAIKENGVPALIALRLKVGDNNLATEAETIVARTQTGGLARPEGFVRPNPLLVTALKPGERVPRDQMIKIADSYFTGLDTDHSGKNVPFDPQCQRRENGMETAHSSDPKAGAMQRLGCKEQFDTGFSVFVTHVRERRYPIVDEERGLVYALVFFDHAGNVASYTKPSGEVVPVRAPFRRPLTFMIGELFKIQSGRIRQIEAVLLEVPYGMPSGWNE